MKLHNLDQEQLDAIKTFGETGQLTEYALCAIGKMVEGWETRIDDIWKQMPREQTSGTSYTQGYRLTESGIEAWGEDYHCGDTETYEATIPMNLFLDDNYSEKLRIAREESEQRRITEQKKREAARKAAKTKREKAEYERLKKKFATEDN